MSKKEEEKIQMKINPDDLEQQVCSCGCRIFIQGFTLNKIKKIIGQVQIAPMPIFFCGQCGKEFSLENK